MKVFVDPYMDRKNGLLKNTLNITDRDTLNRAEAHYTSLNMREMVQNPIEGKFDFAHLCKIHEAIFKDVYEWAGSPRIINIEKPERVLGGLSVEYTECDEIHREANMILTKMNATDWNKLTLDEKAVEFSKHMADLWKVHPFREGNTRTTVTFCCDFADSNGFGLDRNLFKDNSEYMRDALVAASAKFSDIGDHSQPEHLYKIVKDSMERGEKARQAEKGEKNASTMGMSAWKDAVNSPAQGIGQTGRENIVEQAVDEAERS